MVVRLTRMSSMNRSLLCLFCQNEEKVRQNEMKSNQMKSVGAVPIYIYIYLHLSCRIGSIRFSVVSHDTETTAPRCRITAQERTSS